MKNNIVIKVWWQVDKHVRAQVRDPAGYQVRIQVVDKVWGHVWRQVEDHVSKNIFK